MPLYSACEILRISIFNQNDMILQLTKQSTDQEIKAYFEEVLRMSRDSEEFPVNLDDVWPLVFGRKEEAVRALKNDRLFVENIDYQVLRKMRKTLIVLRKDAQNLKEVARLTFTCSPSPALSSSSPARFAQCSRSIAKCFTRWQAES